MRVDVLQETAIQTTSDWTDITYLLHGNERQRAAYRTLLRLGVFELLASYSPTLVGTIPIDIDVAGSDLDIICEAEELDVFARVVRECYGKCAGFRCRQHEIRGVPSVVANFETDTFPIELFAQPKPVTEQHAFRHMIVEARLLEIGGPAARAAIRQLKREGLKTEPAFATYFGFDGDPYEALLYLYPFEDEALRARIDRAAR